MSCRRKKMEKVLMFIIALASVSAASAGQGRGGGFSMEAGPFLKAVATDLAMEIRNADPSVFSEMPNEWRKEGWTSNRLASVIENVCQEEDALRSRPDSAGKVRRLIFD